MDLIHGGAAEVEIELIPLVAATQCRFRPPPRLVDLFSPLLSPLFTFITIFKGHTIQCSLLKIAHFVFCPGGTNTAASQISRAPLPVERSSANAEKKFQEIHNNHLPRSSFL